MCTGLESAIPLLIAGGGTAISAVNKNQALRRADKELARGIIGQGKLDREAAARLTDELDKLGTSGPDQERREALTSFRNTLRENQDVSEGALGDVSGASERFAEGVAAGRQKVGAGGQARADILSRINAPLQQRQREGLSQGRLGIDFGNIAQRSSSEDFLARLRASQQQPNPFIDALGQFATSFGTAKALRPPKTPTFDASLLVEPPFDPLDPGRL